MGIQIPDFRNLEFGAYQRWVEVFLVLKYILDHHQPGAQPRRSQTAEEALLKAH